MSKTVELGRLTSADKMSVDDIEFDFDLNSMSTFSAGDLTDTEIADKAVADAREVPSVWFVNFPSKDAATEGSSELKKFMEDVLDYRSWASLVWWRTVYGHDKIPQDNSKPSIAKRSAFAAKCAMKHMKETPWLAMSQDNIITRNISCESRQFHTQLISVVLAGFVGITPAVLTALEAILTALANTVEVSTENEETRTLVCEKYEYHPEADTIRSYVRIISFSITEKVKDVHKAKKDSKTVTCDIQYVEYEATFNRNLWQVAAEKISASQKEAAEDFVDNGTIDIDP